VYVITDLVQIRRLGEKKRDENEKFRRWIKSHNFVERQFRAAAHEVHEGIDCRQCAECCRIAEVNVTRRDIETLSKHLRITPKQFREQYTHDGEDGDMILKRSDKSGCVFLNGKDCSVYEFRPKTCEGFPHLLRGMGSIQFKMWSYVERATYCPIVYNWVEKVKGLTNFRKP
jgi:Fe-S-cluster containining protein